MSLAEQAVNQIIADLQFVCEIDQSTAEKAISCLLLNPKMLEDLQQLVKEKKQLITWKKLSN